jgi:competence/damage-inducible protein CinA-like protein
MPTAEILTIGTEILLGEIVDTNTRYLAHKLRQHGIDLYRQTTVGDNVDRISQAIQNSLSSADIIITTGGLGPTVDDPTRQAVALAVGVEIEFREELWQQIKDRYRRFGRIPTENNKRQAFIPQGAIPIENPVGTAPAFIFEKNDSSIIALPGVPREMEYLIEHTIIPYLINRLDLHSVIKARIIHTAGVGESQIDELIGDLELFSNPTVGLAAHSGPVDVRITANAETEEIADALNRTVEHEIHQRLGDWIYGADQERLEQVALDHLASIGWELAVVEAGLKGEFIKRLASARGPFIGGEVLTRRLSDDDLFDFIQLYQEKRAVDIVVGLTITPDSEQQEIYLAMITPEEKTLFPIRYGGPPENAPRWAINKCLDILRTL